MHPELENLINLAFADGVLTDKKREIILRKAEKLGEDVDEIEMILEGKISSISKENNNNGNISIPVIKKEAKKDKEDDDEEDEEEEEDEDFDGDEEDEELLMEMEKDAIDDYVIMDNELVERCEFWVKLVKEKKFKGIVYSFPVQKSVEDTFNKIDKTIDKAFDKAAPIIKTTAKGIDTVNKSLIGGAVIGAISGINDFIPTTFGNVVSKSADLSGKINSPDNVKSNNSKKSTNYNSTQEYVEYSNEQICQTTEWYIEILEKRKVKNVYMNEKYHVLSNLFIANKKAYEDSLGKFGKAFRNFMKDGDY